MQVTRTESGAFVVSEIEPPLDLLLQAIPSAGQPGESREARERLYPDPVTDSAETEVAAEWKEYVRPGLEEWFRTAADTVEGDLRALEAEGTFKIPAEHIDAWLNALNQARLVLAVRHGVTEEDMERPVAPLVEEGRDLALFQIHFYGFLQECLVRGLESDTAED